MSLIYEEFESSLPPSMSDKEIEVLKSNYKRACILAKIAKEKQVKVTEVDVKDVSLKIEN